MLLLPMIYRVVKVKTEYSIMPLANKFDTPKRIYGSIGKKAEYFWKVFRRKDRSLGVLLTGMPGTGKTELSKLLANHAIKGGMPVIMISEITMDTKLLQLLSSLDNVCLFFDEFGKVVNRGYQDKMLTMLSDTQNTKKLFILTENHEHMISEFIRNRPGRIRYHVEFGRIDEETFNEYIADFPIREKFKQELIAKYKTQLQFTFDHLMAIVDEHLISPESTLDQLLEILNLKILVKPVYIKAELAYLKDEPDTMLKVGSTSLKYEYFVNGSSLRVEISKLDPENPDAPPQYLKALTITNDDVVNTTEDEVVVEKEGFKIILNLTTDNNSTLGNNQPPRPPMFL